VDMMATPQGMKRRDGAPIGARINREEP